MIHASDDPATEDFTALLLPAQRLRITTIPCRVRFLWFGAEKALTPAQQTRFDEAIRLADQASLDELTRLVGRLCERIAEAIPGGSPRGLRDGAVHDLVDIIDRYRRFDLHSEAQLDELVALVQQTLEWITPQRLREHQGLRRRVASQLSYVRASLDAMRDDGAG
jgi:hypothetical protein